jgi:hypothetical protein
MVSGMRKIVQAAWVPALVLWIGIGVIVHQTSLEPILAYIVGSFAALSTPFIVLARERFEEDNI